MMKRRKIELRYKVLLGFLAMAFFVTIIRIFLAPFLEGRIHPVAQAFIEVALYFIIAYCIGYISTRSNSRDLKELIQSSKKISAGDLTRSIRLKKRFYSDETTDLAESINQMLANLRELVGHMQRTSINIAESANHLSSTASEMNSSTEEVSETVEEISKGAELQAELVEGTSKTVREMAATIELTSNNAQATSTYTTDASNAAQDSGDLARLAMEKMQSSFEKMDAGINQVFTFSDKVQQIGKIVEVITNIARQTNLLALNATIEAARAGEYGKGFAVVADEVRKLAENTAQSTEAITQLVEEIREESGRVAEGMRESTQGINEGREDLATINRSLEGIMQMIQNAANKVKDISDLSQVQAEGARDMVRAMDEIAKVTHENASSTQEVSAATQEQTASMQEMASSAQQLNQLSEELRALISRFRISEDQPPPNGEER